MFSSLLSFDGRIRRTEYGITAIIGSILLALFEVYFEKYIRVESDLGYLLLLMVPVIWIILAQGAKRCHDIGKSGWWQLIPFFNLVLLFKNCTDSKNEYGNDPKSSNDPIFTPQNNNPISKNKQIFLSPFSFEGRIRRTEFAISFMIFITTLAIAVEIYQSYTDRYETTGIEAYVFLLFVAPLIWFMSAQGAKRCHDLNNSGWWQLIPFSTIWLIFKDGDNLENFYGLNPKYQNGYLPINSNSDKIDLQSLNKKVDLLDMVTTLNITSITYSSLQKLISRLNEMKVLKNVTYEFDKNQACITLTHEGDTQTLLEKLHLNLETIDVISVKPGLIVVDTI